ncbi:MAG: hypothetical protein HYU85_03120 [Chloroflexi bacterium]|nr:hypothetical protein [Chloroflexota bacterium]MBI3041111.1 hypothetical protein [Chloroflexota bacterium]MBI3931241.1 hypothetical protein [Chloroflexota bacterium]
MLIDKCKVWLSKNWLTVLVAVLLASATFVIGWSGGRSSLVPQLEEIADKYKEIKDTYEQLKTTNAASLIERQEGNFKPSGEVSYTKKYQIDTSHIAAAKIALGKGEVFEGRLSLQHGAIIFWIDDPMWRKVVDAGRVEGVYEFAFTAEVSGDYLIVFDDKEGKLIVYLEYNSPASLRDASVDYALPTFSPP